MCDFGDILKDVVTVGASIAFPPAAAIEPIIDAAVNGPEQAGIDALLRVPTALGIGGVGEVAAGASDAAITAGVGDQLTAASANTFNAAPTLGAAAAPAGASAAGAGSIGDVIGAGGSNFNLPGALGGNPDLSAGIGTGASSGTSVGTGSFSAPVTGSLVDPTATGANGFPTGGGSASAGDGGLGGVPDAGLGGFISPGPDATVAATPLGSPSTPSFTGPQPTATGPFGQAVATPGGAPGTSASPAGGPSTWENLQRDPLGTIGNGILNHPGTALSAGVLGLQALTQPSLPNPTTISNSQQETAGNLTSQGQSLLNSLNTGQIPAGAQGALDQATNSAIARIRSQYAGMGLPGSTMETQAINQVQQQAEAQKFSIIQSLVNTGLNETQLGNSIYNSLLQSTLSQDKALSDSISRFAAASAGGRPLVVAGG